MTGRTRQTAFYPLALAAFSGATDIPWLRCLRRGFRHVFVAVNDGTHWITLDPLSHRTEIAVQPVPADFDLAGYYRRKGLRVLEIVPPAVPPRLAPVALCTCVEAAKRVLGIHHPFVVTPWQLYRHLGRLAGTANPCTPDPRRPLPMMRIFSNTRAGLVALGRRIADLWRALRRWTARQWERLTGALTTLFN